MSASVALARESLNTGNTSGTGAKSKTISNKAARETRAETRNLSNVTANLFSKNLLTSGTKLLGNRQQNEQLSLFLNNNNNKNNNQNFITQMSSSLTTDMNLVDNDGNKSTIMDRNLYAGRNEETRATANLSQQKRISAIPVPVSRNSELNSNDRKSYLNQTNSINNQSISSTGAARKLDEISSQSVFYSTQQTKPATLLPNSPESSMTDGKKGHKRSSSLATSDEARPIFSKSLANKIANARNNYQSLTNRNSNNVKNEAAKNGLAGLQKPNSKLPVLGKQTGPNKLTADGSLSVTRQKDSLVPIQSTSTVSSLSTKSSKLTAIPLQSNSNKTK